MNNAKKHGVFEVFPGKPNPFGATVISDNTVNFSVFSLHATSCELVLFNKNEKQPFVIIPFPNEYKVGGVFNMVVKNIDYKNIEYGYRMDGPFNPSKGHWFDRSDILFDPYAKLVGGREVWGKRPDWSNPYQHRARIDKEFEYCWDNDRLLKIPMEDMIIYEMHVRGLTNHPSSNVKAPGTYKAVIEKIPYLKSLGINAVELLPIFEFDEFFKTYGPQTVMGREHLNNYWGYDPIGYFAPKAGYSESASKGLDPAIEFKDMVKALHKEGIEVILDVVFNHTGELNKHGPAICFRGIDNKTYYMLEKDGEYSDYTGCYNTVNCNHPVVREFIKNCLRYWVTEFHIDGFRFDLASVLVRGQDGTPLKNPPLIEAISHDPFLKDCKLIAEAWDAAGLYQVGNFPSFGRWSEWNGRYRDDVRKFVKGDDGCVGAMIQRLQGSPDLYGSRCNNASVNFITAHDGFTLYDIYAYSKKHNEANAEKNRDGCNDNFSWNCGAEGETKEPIINQLRKKLIKNAVSILMLSQGVPMFVAGDEIGRTQMGNNNAYCQDNVISWVDWNLADRNKDVLDYFKKIIAFRNRHSIIRNGINAKNKVVSGGKFPEVSMHGVEPWHPDTSWHCRTLAVMYDGKHSNDDIIYFAMNMHWEPIDFILPKLSGMEWYVFADTGKPHPFDIYDVGKEQLLKDQLKITIEARSVVILVGR